MDGIRGCVGARGALQSLGGCRAASVQLGAGWSQVSLAWGCWNKTNANFQFCLGWFSLPLLILSEINKCMPTAGPCPHGEGFCPWSQTAAMHKLMWTIQHKWKEGSQHLQNGQSEDVVVGEEHPSDPQMVLIAVKRASHPWAVLPFSSSFLPTLSVCLLSYTNWFCLTWQLNKGMKLKCRIFNRHFLDRLLQDFGGKLPWH